MTRDAVLKKIKNKFGSYAVFVRMAGLDDYEFRKDFARPDAKVSDARIEEMNQFCKDIPFVWNNKLTKHIVVALRKSMADYGGVRKFVKDQIAIDPGCGYSEDPIFKILAAKKSTITPTTKKLMAHFGISATPLPDGEI